MTVNGRYLLDTNIIIALFADEEVIKNNLAQANEVLFQVSPLASCFTVQEGRDEPKRILPGLMN